MSGPGGGAATSPPAWVAAALGPDLVDVVRLPWGFTNETWGATTPVGERYAVTRMTSSAAAAFVRQHGPEIARRVAATGLAMPVPLPLPFADPAPGADDVVVSRWLEGVPAMQLLSGAEGAARAGRAAGDAWRRLRDVDVDGLDLDATWAAPQGLGAAAAGWLATTRGDLAATAHAGERAIRTVGRMQAPARPSFVHGDLVPANILLHPGGDVLLDVEAARIGDPLFDAAWFRWIVGYHHPELLPAAWAAFVAAAGAPELADAKPDIAARLGAFPVLRVLEVLASPGVPTAARGRWVDHLAAAAALLAGP